MKNYGFFHSRTQGGFSLIEMLFVIVVIAFLLGITTMQMRSPASATSVKGAVDTSANLVALASQVARSQQAASRLVINVDPSSDGYLIQAAVFKNVSPDPFNPGNQWQMVGQAKRLGQNAYFDIQRSRGHEPMSVSFKTDAIQYGNTGSSAVYYAFDKNGQFQPGSTGAGTDGSRIIFTAGILSQSGNTYSLTVPDSMKTMIDGVYLRRYGGTSRYDSPNQIP